MTLNYINSHITLAEVEPGAVFALQNQVYMKLARPIFEMAGNAVESIFKLNVVRFSTGECVFIEEETIVTLPNYTFTCEEN